MDVFEAIANRRSMRTYTDAPVSREKLMQVLEAARLAPSWKNDQGWRFLVLDNRADILALGQALGQTPTKRCMKPFPTASSFAPIRRIAASTRVKNITW